MNRWSLFLAEGSLNLVLCVIKVVYDWYLRFCIVYRTQDKSKSGIVITLHA